MTVLDHPRTVESTDTRESEQVAKLRAMLKDEAHRADWPEIRQAIDYLIADTFVADLAA